MRIEDEIKQEHFESEYHKLGINLLYTQTYFDNILAQAFKPFKTTSEQYNVLRILKGQHPNPMSVKDIQSRMINKMFNTSRLIDKLKQNNFVQRVECEYDRRAVDVSLTKEGLKHLSILTEKLEPYRTHYEILSEKEAKQLNRLLDKLRG